MPETMIYHAQHATSVYSLLMTSRPEAAGNLVATLERLLAETKRKIDAAGLEPLGTGIVVLRVEIQAVPKP